MLKKLKALKRLGIIFSLIILIGLTISFYAHGMNLNDIKNYINSFGPLVPIVLLILIIITSSIGFIFSIPVAMAAFVLSVPNAFVVSILGLTIGAMISFFAARSLGRDYVEKEVVKKMNKLKHYDEHLKKKGFRTILFFRLMPLMPYELVNIVAGLSRVSPSAFFFGTIFGIIPGSLITIYLVQLTKQIRSPEFILVVILWATLCLLPLLSRKVRKIMFG